MHGQVDLSKGSSPKHLSNSVEIESGLRRLLLLVEGLVDLLHDECDFLGPRTQPLNLEVELVVLLAVFLNDALRLQDLSKECFLVDIACDLPYLCFVFLRDERPVRHLEMSQVRLRMVVLPKLRD